MFNCTFLRHKKGRERAKNISIETSESPKLYSNIPEVIKPDIETIPATVDKFRIGHLLISS